MRTLLIVAVCLLLAGEGQDDTVKEDLKKLQGKWLVVAVEAEGNKLPADKVKGELVFTGNRYAFKAGADESGEGTFTIDPSKKPKHMDATPKGGPLDGKVVPEIYDLEGDSLKLCFPTTVLKRPTEFKADAGSGQILVTYKREKK